MEVSARRAVRILVLGAIALWALGRLAFVALTPLPSGGIFGWSLSADGHTIGYVMPGGPADTGGIRAGDRVQWTDMPLALRSNLALSESVPVATRVPVTFFRDGIAHHTTLVSVPWSRTVQQSDRWATAVGVVLIAIGIVLVQLRPSRMTWSFLLSFVTLGVPWGGSAFDAQSIPLRFIALNGAWAILTGIVSASILIFMSRFPTDRPRGALAVFDRTAIPLGALTAAVLLFLDFDVLYGGSAPPAWLLAAYQYGFAASFTLLGLTALIIAYANSDGSDRHRIIPVLCAFAAFLAVEAAMSVYMELYTDTNGTIFFLALLDLSMLALAAAVANGVIRHRVIDVSFVISRTVVYTMLTSIVVGAFVLIDFISSKVLAELQIAVVLEAAAALAFGIWLNALHARIDRFVDSVLFRRRHLAEQHLERASKTLMHAESAQFIDEVLVVEASDVLSLASAAVFHRDADGNYVRALESGWGETHCALLLRDDHLIINLLAELDALEIPSIRWPYCNVPEGLAQPLLAIPFVVRHEMLGFVLYAGHAGGEAIDPDERRVLIRLSAAAAAAYDHIRSKAAVAEANELRAENVLLIREQHLLREMVDALRSAVGKA